MKVLALSEGQGAKSWDGRGADEMSYYAHNATIVAKMPLKVAWGLSILRYRAVVGLKMV